MLGSNGLLNMKDSVWDSMIYPTCNNINILKNHKQFNNQQYKANSNQKFKQYSVVLEARYNSMVIFLAL